MADPHRTVPCKYSYSPGGGGETLTEQCHISIRIHPWGEGGGRREREMWIAQNSAMW